MLNKVKYNKGFSVVEVVICISIISVGMMAVFTLLIQNIQVQSMSKNKLIASVLAQEGIELVREIRDNNWILARTFNIQEWASGDTTGPGFDDIIQDGTYTIDITDFSIDLTANDFTSGATRLYLQNGSYVHDSTNASSTPFSRLITVTMHDVDVDGIDESMTLTSDVMWTQNGREMHYVAQTRLFDWVQ